MNLAADRFDLLLKQKEVPRSYRNSELIFRIATVFSLLGLIGFISINGYSIIFGLPRLSVPEVMGYSALPLAATNGFRAWAESRWQFWKLLHLHSCGAGTNELSEQAVESNR